MSGKATRLVDPLDATVQLIDQVVQVGKIALDDLIISYDQFHRNNKLLIQHSTDKQALLLPEAG